VEKGVKREGLAGLAGIAELREGGREGGREEIDELVIVGGREGGREGVP